MTRLVVMMIVAICWGVLSARMALGWQFNVLELIALNVGGWALIAPLIISLWPSNIKE